MWIKSRIGSAYQLLPGRLSRQGKRSRRVLFGSASILVSMLISTIARMAIVTLLARLYMQEEFGIWVTITSTTAILMMSDFGIGNALRNKLSSLAVQGKRGDAEAREYYLSVLYFSLVGTLLLSLMLLVLGRFVPVQALFKTSDQAVQQAGAKILLTVQLIILLGIPFGISGTAFFGYQEAHWSAVVTIARALLGAGVVFGLALAKQSIVGAAISYFLAGLLAAIIGTVIFLKKRRWNPLEVRVRLILPHVFELFPLSLKFGIGQVAWAFICSIPTITISATIGLGQAAEYNLVQKLYLLAAGLYQCIFNPLWAGYADAANSGDWEWCRKALKTTLLITAALFVVVNVVLVLLGNFFLSVWVGKGYESKPALFLLLGIGILASVLGNCASQFQNALGRINLSITLTVVIAVVSTPFLSAMGRRSGLIGVATGTVLLHVPLATVVSIQAFAIVKANSRRQLAMKKKDG